MTLVAVGDTSIAATLEPNPGAISTLYGNIISSSIIQQYPTRQLSYITTLAADDLPTSAAVENIRRYPI